MERVTLVPLVTDPGHHSDRLGLEIRRFPIVSRSSKKRQHPTFDKLVQGEDGLGWTRSTGRFVLLKHWAQWIRIWSTCHPKSLNLQGRLSVFQKVQSEVIPWRDLKKNCCTP